MQRKRGEVLDDLVKRAANNVKAIEDMQFRKVATIQRVMHNLNSMHEQNYGKPLWDSEASFNRDLRKTAEKLSIIDLEGLPIDKQIDNIINNIGD